MNQRLFFFPVPHPTWLCGMKGKHCTHEPRIAEVAVQVAVFSCCFPAVGASKIPRSWNWSIAGELKLLKIYIYIYARSSCFDYMILGH